MKTKQVIGCLAAFLLMAVLYACNEDSGFVPNNTENFDQVSIEDLELKATKNSISFESFDENDLNRVNIGIGDDSKKNPWGLIITLATDESLDNLSGTYEFNGSIGDKVGVVAAFGTVGSKDKAKHIGNVKSGWVKIVNRGSNDYEVSFAFKGKHTINGKIAGQIKVQSRHHSANKNSDKDGITNSRVPLSPNYFVLPYPYPLTISQMAASFAPANMKFEKGAGTYPQDMDKVYGHSSINGNRLVLQPGAHSWFDNRAPARIITYYEGMQSQQNWTKWYVVYWWCYNIQPACDGVSGRHDYDWERVLVAINPMTFQAAHITYFQHKEKYTKRINNRYDTPDVWVGKNSHGSYHRSFGTPTTSCCYWDDFVHTGFIYPRNALDLRPIDGSTPAQLFSGQWGGIGRGPLFREGPAGYDQMRACGGNRTRGCVDQSGCWQSDYQSAHIGSITHRF